MPTRAEYEAAGLLTRVKTSVDDRVALLDWLGEQGFTTDEMIAAHAQAQLHSLASDRILLSGRSLTLDEAAARSGVAIDVLRSILRAAGFHPDRATITETSLELFAEFANARALFTDAEALHFTRVMGSSLARIAEAANSMFLVDVEAPLMTAAPSELELAKQSLIALASLENVSNAIGALFRLHMYDAVSRSRDARQHAEDPDLVSVAVGFVDLVGFTPLTVHSSARQLIDLVVAFESRAYDIVTEHGGRVVKLIGDEVMFTSLDSADACAIVQAMFADLDATEVTPRAGIAFGEVLAHGGDYYGSVVNLASRVADIAVPWEILITDAVASRLPASFPVEPAGRRLLKGFIDPIALHSLTIASR